MIDLDTLTDSLGESLVRRVVRSGRPAVSDVLLADGDAPAQHAGALLLGNGVRDEHSALLVLESARATGACAVVLRAPFAEAIADTATQRDVTVLELQPMVSWTHFVWLVRSILDQSAGSSDAIAHHPVDYGELFEFADAAAAIVSAPVTIEDAFSRVLAYSALQDTADPVRISTIVGRRVPEPVVRHFRSRGVFRKLMAATEPFRVAAGDDVLERLVVPVRAGREFLGSVWVVDPGVLSDDQLAELVRTASVIALHLLRLRAVFGAARRVTIERLRSVLITGDETADRLPAGPWRVVALGNASTDTDFRLELWELTLRRLGWSQPLLTDVDGVPVTLASAVGRLPGSWLWLCEAAASLADQMDALLAAGRQASSDVHAAVRNIDGKTVRATVEVGYQIGYPVSVAPNGVKVTAHTPELKLTGGVNAKIAPEVTISGSGGGGKIGEIGAELGAEATVIPSADLEFEVGAGKITTVTLAEIALTQPTADIVLSGIELNTTNALGPISVRPYAKISVTTDTGVYVYYDHGPTSRI